MKATTKISLLVAIDELVTLMVWVALAVLVWRSLEGLLAEHIGAVIAQPSEPSAWFTLLTVAALDLILMIGMRTAARSIVGIVTGPLIEDARTARPPSDRRTD